MSILYKFILSVIKESKFRTFLIIISIALSGGLIFNCMGLTESLLEIYKSNLKQEVGQAEIVVTRNEKSPSYFLDCNLIKPISEQTDYIMNVIEDSIEYEYAANMNVFLRIRAVDLDTYLKNNEMHLIEGNFPEKFNGNQIIISIKTANQYDLKVGDEIRCHINGGDKKFKVTAISYNEGYFHDESMGIRGIVPLSTIQNTYGVRGRASAIYIKGKEGINYQDLINRVSQIYPKYDVKWAIDPIGYEVNLGMIQVPMVIMSIIVIVLSIFIIYSTFKSLIMNRIKSLGTFTSIGASKGQLEEVLLLESLGYGVIGGMLACSLGYLFLKLITMGSIDSALRATAEVKVPHMICKLVITFVSSIALCIGSSWMPIKKIVNIPCKVLILNNRDLDLKGIKNHIVIALVLILIGIIIPQFIKGNQTVLAGIISMCLCIIGIIQLLPKYTQVVTGLIEKVFRKIGFNIGVLGVSDIRTNNCILNNIQLVTLGVMVIMLIVNVGVNVKQEVLNMYSKDIQYDIEFIAPKMNRMTCKKFDRLGGDIKSTYPIYEANMVEVEEWNNNSINYIAGIKGNEYDQFIKLDLLEEDISVYDRLGNGRNILVSSTLRERYNLKKGDRITLKLNSRPQEYTIIGFFYSLLWNGSYGIVDSKYLKMDMKTPYYSRIYIKNTGDVQQVKERIEKLFNYNYYTLATTDETKEDNVNRNNQIMSLLIGIIALGICVGSFGIINNLVIYFIDYKHNIAIFKSVGMTKWQLIQMFMIEAIVISFIASSIGLLGGSLLVYIMPKILMGVQIPIKMPVLPDLFIFYIVGTLVVLIVTTGITVRKSIYLNIIEEIKVE